MNNFIFQNPTKLVFGNGQIAQLAHLIPVNKNIMITYGGGSIFKNGIYDQVKEALRNHKVSEFGGIEPNPEYETLMRCIAECRERGIDFLLAVGGGSVIDGTKFIATALTWDGDPWDFLEQPLPVNKAVPLATVLTIPATGSEMNNGSVISRRERKEKLFFFNDACYPQFSILDPAAIYSLPQKQIANGIIDTYVHVVEQYLTCHNNALVQEYWAEGILKTLIGIAPKLMKTPTDYNTCSNFMYAASMALNGFIAMGVVPDWATHMIGQELTALHGLDHGVTLAIVYPGMLRAMREQKREMLIQYAGRVWNIQKGSDDEKIDKAITRTESFFQSLGVKTHLSDYNIGDETIAEIAKRFSDRQMLLGEQKNITPAKIKEILDEVR